MGNQSLHDEELVQLRYKTCKKLTAGKPEPVAVYIRRSINSAVMILELLRGIPFSELSVSLYFITKDSMAKLARVYEAELELALVDSDKFLKGIHKFYNETAIFLKKNNLYREFFACMRATSRMADGIRSGGDKNISKKVLDAYQSLLLQQLEYLRPDKFNFSTRVCGMTADGKEILTCRDYIPDVDAITNYVEESFLSGRLQGISQAEYLQFVSAEFGKHGYKVNNLDELDMLMQRDRLVSYQVSTMLPFINEYTYDIVGANIESPNAFALDLLRSSDLDLQGLQEKLKHRSRMLPTNGQIFDVVRLEDSDRGYVFFKKFLLRETFYDGRIYLLYKADTVCGEFCGYYEPMAEDFFTVMESASMPTLYDNMKRTILYLYGCCVLKEGPSMLEEFSSLFYYLFPDTKFGRTFTVPLEVKPFARGGKLRSAMDSGESSSKGPRKGDDKYEEESRPVQGYIRKLGAGRSASADAIARAEALGFSLALDETYVQPHITTVYIRRKDSEK